MLKFAACGQRCRNPVERRNRGYSSATTVTEAGASSIASFPPLARALTAFGCTVFGASKVLMLLNFGAARVWPVARAAFNPAAAAGVMCRTTLSVGWDGTLYDCDFNQMLEMPVVAGAPARIGDFEEAILAGRRVVTGNHCYGCTAGSGSSCGGATVPAPAGP